jgi:hypothetical protein
VNNVAKPKRNLLDEIAERVGELLKDLDSVLNPRSKKPALVPIPVRNERPRPKHYHNPYR